MSLILFQTLGHFNCKMSLGLIVFSILSEAIVSTNKHKAIDLSIDRTCVSFICELGFIYKTDSINS